MTTNIRQGLPAFARGARATTGCDPVNAVRLPVELTAAVDKWGENHDANHSEAIRRLVEIGLKAKTKG
jgi:hypothetical protein